MIKKHLYLLPLFVLICTMSYAIYTVSATEIILGNKQYAGLAFICLNIILLLFKRKWGVLFTGIGLILGTLNLIAFTPSIITYSIGWGAESTGSISIKFQPYSLLVLAIYLWINEEYITKNFKTKEIK